MKRLVAWCVFLICAATSFLSMAAVQDLEGQIAEVKMKITGAEQLNRDLKAQLAAKETAVAETEARLKQIEDQIGAFQKEHQLDSK
ncbi:MAG: hypothetical protein ACRESK_06925 [Gammaproteobacteria bacterium]